MSIRENEFLFGIPRNQEKIYLPSATLLENTQTQIHWDRGDKETEIIQQIQVIDDNTIGVDCLQLNDGQYATVRIVLHGISISHYMEQFKEKTGRFREKRVYWSPDSYDVV
jgi:hypothetical protein